MPSNHEALSGNHLAPALLGMAKKPLALPVGKQNEVTQHHCALWPLLLGWGRIQH